VEDRPGPGQHTRQRVAVVDEVQRLQVEARVVGQVRQALGRQRRRGGAAERVDRDDTVPVAAQAPDQVRADEARRAGDEHLADGAGPLGHGPTRARRTRRSRA
jgi:hypothetical protein